MEALKNVISGTSLNPSVINTEEVLRWVEQYLLPVAYLQPVYFYDIIDYHIN